MNFSADSIIKSTSVADSLYIQILEKTNSQLSLWWNPYGVMVAALGTLFAMLAIVAVVVIWRQGKEYKELLEGEVAKYKGIVVTLVHERVEEGLASYRAQLESATGSKREDLERRIGELESQRSALFQRGPFSTDASIPYTAYIHSRFSIPSTPSIVTCINCRAAFVLDKDQERLFGERGSVQIECPKCKTTQIFRASD